MDYWESVLTGGQCDNPERLMMFLRCSQIVPRCFNCMAEVVSGTPSPGLSDTPEAQETTIGMEKELKKDPQRSQGSSIAALEPYKLLIQRKNHLDTMAGCQSCWWDGCLSEGVVLHSLRYCCRL